MCVGFTLPSLPFARHGVGVFRMARDAGGGGWLEVAIFVATRARDRCMQRINVEIRTGVVLKQQMLPFPSLRAVALHALIAEGRGVWILMASHAGVVRATHEGSDDLDAISLLVAGLAGGVPMLAVKRKCREVMIERVPVEHFDGARLALMFRVAGDALPREGSMMTDASAHSLINLFVADEAFAVRQVAREAMAL